METTNPNPHQLLSLKVVKMVKKSAMGNAQATEEFKIRQSLDMNAKDGTANHHTSISTLTKLVTSVETQVILILYGATLPTLIKNGSTVAQ